MLDDWEESILMSWWPRSQRNSLKMRGNIGKAHGGSHALQKGSLDQQHERGCGDICIPKGSEDHLWLYKRISWIHKTRTGTFSAKKKPKITLQAKVLLRWPITIWFANLFRCHKRWKNWMQKLQWTKEWKKLESSRFGKSQEQEGGYSRSTKRQKKVHFAALMDICHLKNAELEPQYQKYKDRVVLRGDIVKDDSGAHAVFIEQGSSASQMTAAKVMDVIDCDGQTADAVSAYTQVKMEDAPRLLMIPKSESPGIWIRLQRWSMKYGRRAQEFISPHRWTYVIWKMLNWRQSTKNTKVVVCWLKSRKFWNPWVAARIQGKFGGWWSSWTQRLTRQFFSWTIFRAHVHEKWGFG